MSHHRQHAIDQLALARPHITAAQTKVDALNESEWNAPGEMTAEQGAALRSNATRLLGQILSAIDEMTTLLADETSDLIAIRFMLNVPRKGYDPYGALYDCGSTINNLFQLIDRDGFPSNKVRSGVAHGISNTKSAWEYLDFALWHVNDAIIEELYLLASDTLSQEENLNISISSVDDGLSYELSVENDN